MGKGQRRSMGECDFIALIAGVHQLVKAPIVLVWDRHNTHVSRRMRELIDRRAWLTVFLLPAYSPQLNPVEGAWAHVIRSLANLAVVALDIPTSPCHTAVSNERRTNRHETERDESRRCLVRGCLYWVLGAPSQQTLP
ncbi:transposase [Streptomyces sp. NPDC059002]|uniref:transposase n=1 Tax=Streptomyces sp. NPDC059002 TaxID=3346690 RepID=UPI0036A82721